MMDQRGKQANVKCNKRLDNNIKWWVWGSKNRRLRHTNSSNKKGEKPQRLENDNKNDPES